LDVAIALHFHLEDIAASRIHHHLVPGDGAIDFGPVIQSIRNIGYDDGITVELYPYADNPDEAATTAFERVSKLLA
jgi:sugar phosphate isomerase/epimerase